MNLQARSRPIGIVTSLVFNGIVAVTCALNGLTYLYPPPEEVATLIEFDTDDIIEEQKNEVGTGIEPQDEIADPTQDIRLVQNSEAPQEGTKPNVAREATVGNEGDVDVPEPERDHEIDARSLFPTANNSDKDTVSTAQLAERISDRLNAGHPQGNTNTGNPEGTPNVKLKGEARKTLTLPSPEKDNTQLSGIVVVQIFVNRDGKVIRAISPYTGTTVSSSVLWNLAAEAAKKTQFSSSRTAPEQQEGTITYQFNLR